MNVVGRKLESQVQFWSLLGPFFVLLSIAVLIFKVSPHWYFPISGLIGIPLCVKWKMKGMAAALCCLFLLAGLSYPGLELDDRYWHVGLSLAMAFSFIVMTLSLEEVHGLIGKLQLESQSRLDNFLLLDEKWKVAEQEWSLDKEKARQEIATLAQEMGKVQEEKQTFYKLAQLAKDELVQVRGQHDQLIQDLAYKKQQIAQLQERIEEGELTIQGFVNSDTEKQIQILTERLTCLERDKETFKAKMAIAQEEGQACQVEKEHLWRELQASQEREKLCLLDQHRSQQDKQDLHSALQGLQNRCALMEQEKQAFHLEQTKLQQQYEQMRHLEIQQRQGLQQAQRKIQDLELKVMDEDKQKDSLQQRRKEVEDQLLYQEKQFRNREEQHQITIQQLQKQLEEEKQGLQEQLRHQQQHLLQQSQHNQLSQEMSALQERYLGVQEELVQRRQDLEAKNEVLSQMQTQVNDLNQELSQQEALFKQSAEQNKKLETLKVQLEQALHQTQEQLQKMKQQPEERYHEKLPYAPGNTRQIESMYIQLKNQFQEKCEVLDATRRELFNANEKLLKCQREYEEEHIFDQSPNERALQRHIVQLGRQFEQIQILYQQELDEITQLVGHLLQQIK